MEDIIIFGIIAISVIVNIIRNYKKESAKNAKRVVGKKPQPVPVMDVPAYNPNIPEINTKSVIKKTPSALKTKETGEALKRTVDNPLPDVIESFDYNNIHNEELHELMEVENQMLYTGNEHDPYSGKALNSVFEKKDELKKAIIYSTVLERKF